MEDCRLHINRPVPAVGYRKFDDMCGRIDFPLCQACIDKYDRHIRLEDIEDWT